MTNPAPSSDPVSDSGKPTPNNPQGDFIAMPVPRYPWYVQPTATNWFRTTVNPLCWSLVPEHTTIGDRNHSADMIVPEFQDILLDPLWFVNFFAVENSPLKDRVQHRPDALLHIPTLRQLFQLLTSGRTADREEATRALHALSSYAPHGAPRVIPENSGIQEWTYGRPKERQPGREALGETLRKQIVVWSEKVNDPSRSQRARIRAIEARADVHLTSKAIRDHENTHREYCDLLESSRRLQAAARELYGPGSFAIDVVALTSLQDAVAWLREPRGA